MWVKISNGYAESFSALLELLDNQRFARGVPPDRTVLQSVMVRRLKSELKVGWSGRARFPKRELQPIEVTYSTAERQAYHNLQAYTLLRRTRARDAVEQTATEFVLKLLKKRLLSSPAAFATTLVKHRTSLREATRSSASACVRRPHAGILKTMLSEIDDEYSDDEAYSVATDDAVQMSTALFQPPTPDEQQLLDDLTHWAEQARLRPDQKARTLLDWLKPIVRPHGSWSDQRVILFTEYRDTQKWLQGLLAAEGLTTDGRLLLLYGGMRDDERETVKAAFQASPHESRVRILLATDAASEGIDLQRHCYRLVHYEISWNPNRMEQRNGRIDRHGQAHNPQIVHFAPAGFARLPIDRDAPVGALEGDLEFLMRAVQKVEQIREDLGNVGPVIAEQVTEAMLGTRRRLDTAREERGAEPTRRMLTFERNLSEQIHKLYEHLQETRHALQLEPEHVQSVVQIALELAGQPPLIAATVPGIWPDPTGARRTCLVFHLPALRRSWTVAAKGLEHAHTRKVRPIVFDHELAKGRDDVVLAHLNHPLVHMALRLLRAEVWSGNGRKKLHRVAARVVPNHITRTPLAIAYGRLVVIGGDSHRLHEELVAAGGEISEQGRFRRLQVSQVQAAIEAVTPQEPSAAVKSDLARAWEQIAGGVQLALKTRAREQAESLQRKLDERRDQEISDISRVLDELARAIQKELAEADKPAQLRLDLFNERERDQYRRNTDALRARLAQIPRELEQEIEGIRARYADPQDRLFPVAVMFLVPEQFAH